MISREEAYAITKEAYQQCIRQMPVRDCWLYGSYARGDAAETSDIDLRIDKGSIRGLQFARLLGDLEDALEKKVDLISTSGMDEDFRKSIASEEVLLYERQ